MPGQLESISVSERQPKEWMIHEQDEDSLSKIRKDKKNYCYGSSSYETVKLNNIVW